jgi:hypothetical protein
MLYLIKIVSGVFEFVDVIIQFVDWVKEGGPRVYLETFLAYMLDSPSPSDEQPYRALDHFYVRALSDIHPDVLSAVNEAFGLFLFNKHFYSLRKHPFDFAYLLSLESDISTQPHLERLAITKAYTGGSVKNPYIRNPYFERFLEDPSRSGKFYFPRRESSLHGCQACLHILCHPSNAKAPGNPALEKYSTILHQRNCRSQTICFLLPMPYPRCRDMETITISVRFSLPGRYVRQYFAS